MSICDIRISIRSFDEARHVLAELQRCLNDLTLQDLIEVEGGTAGSGKQLIVMDAGVANYFNVGPIDDEVLMVDGSETLDVKWSNTFTNDIHAGYVDVDAIAAPLFPSPGTARIYGKISGSNYQLILVTAAGVECVICDVAQSVDPITLAKNWVC